MHLNHYLYEVSVSDTSSHYQIHCIPVFNIKATNVDRGIDALQKITLLSKVLNEWKYTYIVIHFSKPTLSHTKHWLDQNEDIFTEAILESWIKLRMRYKAYQSLWEKFKNSEVSLDGLLVLKYDWKFCMITSLLKPTCEISS